MDPKVLHYYESDVMEVAQFYASKQHLCQNGLRDIHLTTIDKVQIGDTIWFHPSMQISQSYVTGYHSYLEVIHKVILSKKGYVLIEFPPKVVAGKRYDRLIRWKIGTYVVIESYPSINGII